MSLLDEVKRGNDNNLRSASNAGSILVSFSVMIFLVIGAIYFFNGSVRSHADIYGVVPMVSQSDLGSENTRSGTR